MITINFKERNIVLAKESNVKYIAKISNFDRKFVFGREFVNGDSIITHDNELILEAAPKDKKDAKKYYIVDTKIKTVKEATYEEVKKMAVDKEAFATRFFR